MGLRTLPATLLFATDTVVTCRIVGNWCTTTELLMREVKGSATMDALANGSSSGVEGVVGVTGAGEVFPEPWVLNSSRI